MMVKSSCEYKAIEKETREDQKSLVTQKILDPIKTINSKTHNKSNTCYEQSLKEKEKQFMIVCALYCCHMYVGVFCSVKSSSQATLVTPLFRYQCLPLRCYIDISLIIIYSPPALCNGYNLPI